MNVSKIAFLFIFLSFCLPLRANVSLPKIFSENMVLQRNAPIPIWGTANAGEKITVAIHKQTVSVIADANGKWFVKLKSEKAATNLTLKITGENTIEIKNVAVGEVWLCSGQSNMEWTAGQSMDAEKELASSDNPNIRHIKIPRNINTLPQDSVNSEGWKISSPINTKDFTGIGYFFAREIYKELKIPIGIINSSWGGTNIETWTSREGFESSDEFREMIAKMPKVDLEAFTRLKVGGKRELIEQMQGVKLSEFNAKAFNQSDFDDSKLPSMNIPELWDSQVLGTFDGIVWLRKIANLTAEQAAKPASIELAKIDDNDETYLNGVKIGGTNQWDAPRKYKVPSGTLKAGQNLIVVKITDTGQGGGVYGDPNDVKINLGDENILLAGKWKFQVERIQTGATVNEYPSLAYNAMINPLIPYSFRGVLWYQGESNASRAYQYRKAFPLLINDWRQKWGNARMPFYFVQLASYKTIGNSNEGCPWAELREAQSMALNLPDTGMAVTTDIGDPKDIHPRNKQEAGRRLAAIALNRLYRKRMADSGPAFKSMKIEGNKIIVSFENAGSGLIAKDANGMAGGFEIAGADRKFYDADARIEGKRVVVSSGKVASPVAVRFGWIGDASANNLFNKEGFPAIPFRSDDWKSATKDAKYKIMDLKN